MNDLFDQKNHPQFSSQLPKDELDVNVSRQVFNACYSEVTPKVPTNPSIVHFSNAFLKELDLQVNDIIQFSKVMSGAEPFNKSTPYAMCYGGHQFGHWAGQLGDGRAINIAEIEVQNVNWKLQLKGAGPTPYSRGSDGLAVLRSSIREYLCSEAMHHLGIPTTRALSLVKTGDKVLRDIMYDGNQAYETGAIVCRMAPSFLRFGSYEIFAVRGDAKNLKTLVDYTIKNHFNQLGEPSKDVYLKFFREVVLSTKNMILNWQRVGFVHGVMNTDNMSILGLTIDYGPYGWLENYDPNLTPNTTDARNKRYRFGNQASVALWNLTQLANALYPLVEEAKPFESILKEFKISYVADYHEMMCQKLGIKDSSQVKETFVSDLEKLLDSHEIDMTIFFRNLSNFDYSNTNEFLSILHKSSYQSENDIKTGRSSWESWLQKYVDHLSREDIDLEERKMAMNKVNPKYVLRNFMAQLAIDAAENDDYSILDELYHVLLRPYEEQPDMEKWFTKRPDWALDKVGCSMLSCSS